MQKLVIQTQYRENYAYPEWDGKGEVPQGWKFKGGSTYVVNRFTDVDNITEVMKNLSDLITYGNPASEEYILSWEIVDQGQKVCEDWDTPTEIFIYKDKVDAMRITDNREDGYMRSEILEKTEAWTMLPDSERKDYNASYLMNDGDIVDSEAGLREWFGAAA